MQMRLVNLIVTSLIIANAAFGQTIPAPSSPPSTSVGKYTAKIYSDEARARLAMTPREGKSGLVPGCEGPDALKQFPFVKINEYNGEEYVGEFKTPKGKLWADRRNTIRVCIDPTLLTEDAIYSQGDISMVAQLGDRAISVEGYAEVGKNFEKFQPAVVRTVQYALNYGTIVQLTQEALDASTSNLAMSTQAQVVSDVFALLLDGSESTLATARITDVSETELKAHLKALRDAIKAFTTISKDATANAAQVDAAIAATKTRLASLEAELLEAVTAEADIAANPNSDAIKKQAARTRTVELSNLHLQLRTDLKTLQARKNNLANADALRTEAAGNLRAALSRTLKIFSLAPKPAVEKIVQFTSTLRAGQIYLRKEDAKRGDVLRVLLLHFHPDFKADGKTANGSPSTETLAEIYIDEFGWKSDVVDSFLLVRSADKKISNFKGAAGASLLWSYRPRAKNSYSFNRTLTPSIGANVSYLDFDPDKEIEIGAGIIFGIFQNSIHFGYGWNLNYDGKHRGYSFLGFSFGKIQDKLTGKQ
jgi:hypothetical protein